MLSPSNYIGAYKLIEPIGQGGMAQVFRGQWIGPERMVTPCSVKIMRPEVASIPNFQDMFLDEARLSMLLNHSNIYKVFGAGSEPTLHIVMEWINGMTLAEISSRLVLSRTPLEFGLIEYIVASLLRGLRAAHHLIVDRKPFPIIHRDVSPQNVMISVHGEVKLMDFGIARALAYGTGPADLAGKLRYLPQEQLDGKVGPQTDLFSAGAVLHELVEGVLFRADHGTEIEMISAIQSDHVPVLARPGVPQNIRELHRALLQPDPHKRPQTANAALAILGRVTVEQDPLGQIVSSLLGPRASVSGSTIADFVVPDEVASAEPGNIGTRDSEESELPDEVAVEDGQVLVRTPTVVVSRPGATSDDAPDEVSQPGILIPRDWARAVALHVPERRQGTDQEPSAADQPGAEVPGVVNGSGPRTLDDHSETEVTRVRVRPATSSPLNDSEEPGSATVLRSALLLSQSDGIEVRYLVDEQWEKIEPSRKLSVAPDHYTFKWRRNGETNWSDGSKHNLQPGKVYRLTVTGDKLVVRTAEGSNEG